MDNGAIIEEVIVHPVGGMQLSAGYILVDASRRYVGSLPGLTSLVGDSIEDVLQLMESKAKTFYGDDVIVEIVNHLSNA